MDVIIIEVCLVYQLSAGVYESLLIIRNAQHSLHVSFDGADGIIWRALHSICVICQSLNVDFDGVLGFV